VHHGVVDRTTDADGRQNGLGIIAGAGELHSAAVDQEQIAALAGGKASDVIAAEKLCAAARGHLQEIVAGGRFAAGIEPVQQECHAELFHQARAIVGCGAVHTQTDRHAELEHFRNPGNAGGKLHVGNRAVADAGAGFSEKLELFGVEMNAVRVPHVRAYPAERFHESKRPHALAL